MQWPKFGFGVQILSVGHCSCSGDYISNWTFPLNRKIWKRFHEKINYNIDSYLQVRCKVEGKLSHFNDQDMTGGRTEPGFAFRVTQSGLLHFKCETKDIRNVCLKGSRTCISLARLFSEKDPVSLLSPPFQVSPFFFTEKICNSPSIMAQK